MARKLPPLHLLHIFEAAGRKLSFKLAGEELHLTPSAISHQVKALEEHLQLPLFQRLTRGVSLTAAGAMYLAVVQDMFQQLDKGTSRLKQRFSTQSLRISTFPSLASNIIIPKLSEFQTAFPDIELRIETGMNLVDLRYEELDLAIRVGSGNWPGVISEKLFDIQVTPVCSAAFADKYQLSRVEQICTVPLLHISYIQDGWPNWGKSVGVYGVESSSSLTLGSYDAAIHAAQQGLGLALAILPIEMGPIEQGVLLRPFAEQSAFPMSCYAVYRQYDNERPDIQAFINWFKLQVTMYTGE
ncbi:LysR substrate-binding domain-containing protein [Neptunicella sp. SCSIO 80796]|uniref:LysR substrate-binding domain-containing protein n=1 Tax=Neptunicella plasticusilytica TaxID=3117012 RepID=UPI003A4DB197